jgi:anti-sigma B factor antagonist
MELTTDTVAATLVITVREPRIDAASSVQFRDIMRTMTRSAAQRIVLDLGEVRFIDSSGLGAIVGARKQLAPEQRMELAALTPLVAKVFALTRMDTVFRIHPTRSDALENDPDDA